MRAIPRSGGVLFVTFRTPARFFAHLKHESVFPCFRLSSRKVGCWPPSRLFKTCIYRTEQRRRAAFLRLFGCLRLGAPWILGRRRTLHLLYHLRLLLRADAVIEDGQPRSGSRKGTKRWRRMALPRPTQPHRRRSSSRHDEVQVVLGCVGRNHCLIPVFRIDHGQKERNFDGSPPTPPFPSPPAGHGRA
ncbi:hypothetical protein GWK47_045416 [Chionoecetes opilio]|uniref:Uncharacterized protein n=1 Tax=Chionoecetes opilio TaxID=41210 RepID=A0A8J4YFI5_CHIOP|nr:hypothetical protein GWK47_045416 [Chionoecetes opilio]